MMDTAPHPPFAIRGIVSSQWAYWCSLAMAALSLKYIPPGGIQTAVLLLPILTALLCVLAAYWIYRECDEYIRTRLIRCVAVTAIVVSFATLAYFFLELLGFPHVSMLWVNLLGWSVFNIQMLLVIYRSR
jgi:hypothetical protein